MVCNEVVCAPALKLTATKSSNAARTGTIREGTGTVHRVHRRAVVVVWFGTWKPPTLAGKICTPSLPKIDSEGKLDYTGETLCLGTPATSLRLFFSLWERPGIRAPDSRNFSGQLTFQLRLNDKFLCRAVRADGQLAVYFSLARRTSTSVE